jgi:hypothetical protein
VISAIILLTSGCGDVERKTYAATEEYWTLISSQKIDGVNTSHLSTYKDKNGNLIVVADTLKGISVIQIKP